jgi:ribonuclease E
MSDETFTGAGSAPESTPVPASPPTPVPAEVVSPPRTTTAGVADPADRPEGQSGEAVTGEASTGDAATDAAAEAARKRRRRGSRGGRNRNKAKKAAAARAAGGPVDEDDEDDDDPTDEGDDYIDAAADRGLTTEDVAATAIEEAGITSKPRAPRAPRAPRVGETRPATAAPAGDGTGDLADGAPAAARPPRNRPAKKVADAPRSTESTRAGESRSEPQNTEPARTPRTPRPLAAPRGAVPAAGDTDAEPVEGIGTDAPARRRRRRGGRGRGGGGTASTAVASRDDAEKQAAAERMLDELDEAAVERRKGRMRKGRPAGRYLMCVHVRPDATQVGVLEGRSLVEHYVSRPRDTTSQIDGNIYLGKVQNVLPGMEAAFIDIGTPKNGVLYRGDVAFDDSDVEGDRPRIERLLKNGQTVVVQVTKNPIGTKGARLTQEVSLAGRFLVMVPGQPGTYGISKRLPDDERKRLRKVLDQIRPGDAGVIVRTAAEGATTDELERDFRRLSQQWGEISKVAERSKPAKVLYKEPDLAIRVIREEFTKEYRGVIIDDRALYEEVRAYVEAITPELADRVEFYDDTLPIFERFHVHEQLHKALDRKVWLPSGGSLIIERTEALTVIDVNTGKNVGRSNLEETVYRNNLEAAEEVARQLRLRDIGGIIVIDFIDMEIKKNRDDVLRTFKDALARDKTRTQVFDISELGLVQMTRKRVSEGLVESFSATCPECNGRGIILDESLL